MQIEMGDRDRDGTPLPSIRERARAKLDRILAEHQPEPLPEASQKELPMILDAAEGDLVI